jgi:hypothetical protein
LYESLEDIEKIRILVGLNVDKETYEIMQINEENGTIDFESHQRTKNLFQKNLITEIENSREWYFCNSEMESAIEDMMKELMYEIRDEFKGKLKKKLYEALDKMEF